MLHFMKRLCITITAFMLAGILTACSGASKTLAVDVKETKAQWGLTFYEESKEAEGETEKSAESESETEAVTTVTEVVEGVKMVSIKDLEIQSVSPVNVRSGPGTEFDKIGGLRNEEMVIMDGICDNKWVHIRFDEKEGYVSMDFLRTLDEARSMDDLFEEAKTSIENNGTAVKATEAETTEEETREEETTKAKETKADETKADDTKAKTTKAADGKNSENGEFAWATIDVNVRKGPGSNYDSAGLLKQGESVKILDSSDSWWWKVEFKGQAAYISVQYLTTDEPEE